MSTASDWTVGPDGRSNTSAAYEVVVDEVERIIRHIKIGDNSRTSARVIVSNLACGFGMAPTKGVPK